MKTFSLIAMALLCGSLAFAQVKITTTSIPEGTVDQPYSVTIETKGGELPFVWSSEDLPAGLTLTPTDDTRTATLTGKPTAASTHRFDISVKGHGGHVSTVAYTLTIDKGTGHFADLAWKAGAKNIAGYNLYRSTTSGGPYSQINTSLLSANQYTDSNVENGTTYYYVATEVNRKGQESAYSKQAKAVIP